MKYNLPNSPRPNDRFPAEHTTLHLAAHMNDANMEMLRNERDVSPNRIQNYEFECAASASSSSCSSSAESGVQRERIMSRASTQCDLEGHSTVLSRVQTARSQHAATVGRTLSGKSRESRRALPQMGMGKPYPPLLPAQEEYVVEFNGPDDPLHAQNWPLSRK